MMNEPVSTIMTTKLFTVAPHDKLSKVKELLQNHRIHHIPVVDGTQLVGIVTTGDLFWLGRSFDDYPNIEVQEVMTRKIATLEPDDKVGSVAEVFLEHRFHCIPVCENGNLLGLVTMHDILKYEFNKEYPNERH
jgi:acetoin utilization protein AcuB